MKSVTSSKALRSCGRPLYFCLSASSLQPASCACEVVSALRRLHHAAGDPGLPAVQLLGNDGGSKLAVARQICASLDRRLYRVGIHALPQSVNEIEALSRLWQRETLLLPVAPVSRNRSPLGSEGQT